MIATHRALYYKADGDAGLALGPGGFISALEQAADVAAEAVGKPSRLFFETCLRTLERDGVDRASWSDIAMVGDDWRSDLGGGCVELGLRRYLVRTGKYQDGDEAKAEGTLAGVEADFAALVDRLLRERDS